ncbi:MULTISPECIES: signal peptidase II [Micromonospora]|uniref:Lipoprotein signal peptidase n=1 Tax=Micromonospora sicca TaxID=2202420 RepID=A0A317D219_9ACTN|nr:MULTISPECIES: signal peptidase II [unclassified Micromonospora]MBM0228655.1 signal peptidase II [Micromonospora sp. ATA51]MDZ5442767.1 signal peptidase II [Micromonospora sp. 4G57]MDZ5492684.1 signal peptidase II [Micromonospora sp. 4G53]PWR08938.1 signal peptidase II [Micromonospora sp. 4G51]
MTAAPPAGTGTAESGGGTPRRRAVGVLLGVALVALLADLVTKQLALTALTGRGPVSLLGGTVYLTLTRNSGAAWSIGSGHTWVFPLITIGVIGWIAWMAARLRSLPWAVSLGLVLGGALGNLTDRIFRAPGHFVGHVVDMISLFDPYGQVWPVFNLADSSLVCGVVLAVLLELTGRQRDGRRAAAEPAGRPESGDGAATGSEQRGRA